MVLPSAMSDHRYARWTDPLALVWTSRRRSHHANTGVAMPHRSSPVLRMAFTGALLMVASLPQPGAMRELPDVQAKAR